MTQSGATSVASRSPRLITFPNGFELLSVPSHTAPAVALDLWVRVGSASERPEQAGIAHLLEHMLFKGTDRRGPGEIAREIEGLGGEVNAYTSYDHTVFTLLVASRFTDIALDVLADAVFGSTFDPAELEREKAVVAEEIKRSRDLPHHVLSRLLFGELFRVHPYGNPVIGTEETVAAIERRDCLTFMRRWYRPSNMTLVAVGDADLEGLVADVQRLFGAEGRPARPRPARRPREPRPTRFRSRFATQDVSEVYFDLAFPAPAASHRDVPALDLLTTVLGQGEASRLQHRVKLDRNLVRSVSAGAYTPRDPGLLYVGGVVDLALLEPAVDAICEELFRLRQEPVGLKELQRAVENVEADFVYQKETVQGQAQKAGFFHVVLGDTKAELEYLERLRAVEPGDIQRAARRYLRAERGVLALLHPDGTRLPWTAPEIERRIARLEEGPGPVEVRRSGRRRSCSRTVLSCGARLLVKVNPAVPVVALRAAFLGGTRREPPAQFGAFHMIAAGMTRGTRGRTVFEIAHAVDSLSGQLDGFSGRNSFGLKGEFLSKYLEDGLELFADVLCNPVFADEEVAKVREDALAALRRRRDNPGGYAFRLFEELLYGQHPFGRDVLGTPESIEGMSAEDVRHLYAASATPAHLAVAVAGDVDPDQVTEFFGHALEGLEPRAVLPPEPSAPDEIAAPRMSRVDSATEQAHVVLGYLGTTIGNPDRYALRVLNGILSGQGGRLFRRLRDELGLAYAVTSACLEGLDRGYLAGYIATDPGSVDGVREELLREFEELRKHPVERAELEQAARKLVGSFEIALQENAFQAAQMALDDIYGLGYRNFQQYARRIFAVTPEDVLSAARRYLYPDGHACLILSPPEPLDRV